MLVMPPWLCSSCPQEQGAGCCGVTVGFSLRWQEMCLGTGEALELCVLLFLAADQLKDEILLAYHLPVYVASRIPLLLFPTQQMAMTQLL